MSKIILYVTSLIILVILARKFVLFFILFKKHGYNFPRMLGQVEYKAFKASVNLLLLVFQNMIIIWIWHCVYFSIESEFSINLHLVLVVLALLATLYYCTKRFLKIEYHFPKDIKEDVLDNMEQIQQNGFLLVLSIVIILLTGFDSAKESTLTYLTFLLALLPFTIVIIVRNMK